MAIPQVPSPLFLSLYLSDSTRTHIDYYSVMGVWLYTFLCFFFVFFLQRVKKKESKAGLILSSVISLAALATLLEVISSPTPATSLSSICSCCANPSAVNNRTLKSWPKEAFPQRQHVGLKKAFVNFFFFDKMLSLSLQKPLTSSWHLCPWFGELCFVRPPIDCTCPHPRTSGLSHISTQWQRRVHCQSLTVWEKVMEISWKGTSQQVAAKSWL